MSGSVCYLDPSLQAVAVYANGEFQEWSQPGTPESAPASIESRAQSSAAFVMSLPARVSTVVVGVEQASFRWVATPTMDAHVVSTVVRRRIGDEQPGPVTATVQPLDASPAKQSTFLHKLSRSGDQSASQPPSTHATALALEDGPVRLWFDVLDRQGTMPRDVITTWHALARIWGQAEPCTMVVCQMPQGQLAWALCHQGSVLVGGQITLGDVQSVASRLTLDWLTWCAQLGVEIAAIHFVMRDPQPLAQHCRARWEHVAIEKIHHDNPLQLLLEQIHEAGTPPEQELADPRRSLTAVTHRANRLHQRLIRIAAASLLLLSVGIGALGFRWHRIGARHEREALVLQENNWIILERATALDAATIANLRLSAAPDRILESQVLEAQQASQPIAAPPAPLPLFAENRTFLELLSQQEGLTLTAINIDTNQSTVTFTSEDYAPAEQLLGSIRQASSRIKWNDTSRGQPPSLFWELKGEWEDESE